MANKTNYAELLKSPIWQKRRLEIMQRDNFTCQKCGSNVDELHVHHRYYVHGFMPSQYPDDALVTLCHSCHEMAHSFIEMCKRIMDGIKIGDFYEFKRGDTTYYGMVFHIIHDSLAVYMVYVSNNPKYKNKLFVDVFNSAFIDNECVKSRYMEVLDKECGLIYETKMLVEAVLRVLRDTRLEDVVKTINHCELDYLVFEFGLRHAVSINGTFQMYLQEERRNKK